MGAQGARPDLATRLDPGRGHPRDRLPFNEEYIRDKDGRLENPGFLDYRVPVAPDVPMIDTVMVENANPRHPFGARGVGEVPIVPPMAAVANAINDAIGVRMRDLPMSPPRLRAAIDAQASMRRAAE